MSDEANLNEPERYIGVSWIGQKHQKYVAQVRSDRHLYNIGFYRSPTYAARVRDVAALILQGPDAKLNFDGTPPPGISKSDIERRIEEIRKRRQAQK